MEGLLSHIKKYDFLKRNKKPRKGIQQESDIIRWQIIIVVSFICQLYTRDFTYSISYLQNNSPRYNLFYRWDYVACLRSNNTPGIETQACMTLKPVYSLYYIPLPATDLSPWLMLSLSFLVMTMASTWSLATWKLPFRHVSIWLEWSKAYSLRHCCWIFAVWKSESLRL